MSKTGKPQHSVLRPRPRRPWIGAHTESALVAWKTFVREVESGVANVHFDCCPECYGEQAALDARDFLESILRRGGRRAEKLAPVVEEIDRRFRSATVPSPHKKARHGRWWRTRACD